MSRTKEIHLSKKSIELVARLDRIPIWPYSYWLLFVLGLAIFFAFFNILTIGYSLPVVVKQFHITLHYALWSVTSSLIGYVVGSFVIGCISDYFGRRIALVISISFFSIGSILSATSPNMVWLIVWRFVTGMGIGAEIDNTCTCITELAPAKCRGRYLGIATWLGFLGFTVTPFIAFGLVPHISWGWRLLFLLGGIGGVLVFFFRSFLLPETARWLVNHGQYERAEKAIEKIENVARKRLKKSLPSVPKALGKQCITSIGVHAFFKKSVLVYILLFALIWFFYYLGAYAWLTFGEELLFLSGFNLSSGFLIISLSSLGFFLGSGTYIFIADRFERKWLAIVVMFFWVVILLLIALLPLLNSLIMVLGFFATYSVGLVIPVIYNLTGEAFPTGVRNTCFALTEGVGHISSAVCGQIIFAIYYLFQNTRVAFGSALIVMAISGFLALILLFFVPKLTNKSLEQ